LKVASREKSRLVENPFSLQCWSESIGIFQKIGLICNLNMSVESAFWPLKQKVKFTRKDWVLVY